MHAWASEAEGREGSGSSGAWMHLIKLVDLAQEAIDRVERPRRDPRGDVLLVGDPLVDLRGSRIEGYTSIYGNNVSSTCAALSITASSFPWSP